MSPVGLILLAADASSISRAPADGDWFVNCRMARFMTSVLGRTGARIC